MDTSPTPLEGAPGPVAAGPGTTPGVRLRRRRGEGDRLRDELLAVATDLLGETGDPEAVSVREVAARAGVTAPSVYRHFADKDALLLAAANGRFAAFRKALNEAAADGVDPRDALVRRGRAYLRFARENPGAYQVMFGGVLPHRAPPTGAAGAAAEPDEGAASLGDLVANIEACIAAGSRPGLEPGFVAVELWVFLHGLAELRRVKPHVPLPTDEELLAALCRQVGLAPAGGPPAPPT